MPGEALVIYDPATDTVHNPQICKHEIANPQSENLRSVPHTAEWAECMRVPEVPIPEGEL